MTHVCLCFLCLPLQPFADAECCCGVAVETKCEEAKDALFLAEKGKPLSPPALELLHCPLNVGWVCL
jgi:hypothetical protein